MKCDFKIQLNYKGVKREFVIPSIDTDFLKTTEDVLNHIKGEVHSVLQGNPHSSHYIPDIMTYMRDVDNGVRDTNPKLIEPVTNFINDKGINFNDLRNHVALSPDNKYAPLIKELISPISDELAPGIQFAVKSDITNDNTLGRHIYDRPTNTSKIMLYVPEMPKSLDVLNNEILGKTLAHELVHFRIDRGIAEAEFDSQIPGGKFTNPDMEILRQMKDYFIKKVVDTQVYKDNPEIADLLKGMTKNSHTILEPKVKQDLREFIAYSLTEPLLKEAMNEITVKGVDEKNNSMLDVLTGWASKHLDVTPKAKSLLSSFYNVSVELFDLDKKGETTYYNAAKGDLESSAPTTLNIWHSTNENKNLSNLATRPFEYKGKTYYSVEHAYQSLKSGEFDEKTYDKYKSGDVKIIGGKGTNTKDDYNIKLMKDLVQESFKQNKGAANDLIATGNSILTHKQDRGVWKEQFPKILTEVRSVLQNSNINLSEYTNHSGGALGSDSEWDTIGNEFGMTSNKHYYYGGKTPKGNVELSKKEIEEGIYRAKVAAKALGKNPRKTETLNLLGRNWFQVKNADAIFAIGKVSENAVEGGTGWAIQMAIDNGKPINAFDQNDKQWYKYDYNTHKFVKQDTPVLTKNFAGIGTRQINENGKQAIRDVYEKTLDSKLPKETVLENPNQKAIDIILHGGIYHEDEKFDGYSQRFDFEMTTAEKKKALSDIKKGNYGTAPAKKMINKVMEWEAKGDYPTIEGTGGSTSRGKAVPAEEIQKQVEVNKPTKEVRESAPKGEQLDLFNKKPESSKSTIAPIGKIELAGKKDDITLPDTFKSEAFGDIKMMTVAGYRLNVEGHPNMKLVLTRSKDSGALVILDERSGLAVSDLKSTKVDDILKEVADVLNSKRHNVGAFDQLGASRAGDPYHPQSKNTQSFIKSTDSTAHVKLLSNRLAELYGLNFRLLSSEDIASIYDTPSRTYSDSRAFLLGKDIIINTDLASTAEPLHEVSHVVLASIKNTDPDLYQELISKVQSHPRYNDIASNYPELNTDDLNEEVFATVFGENYRNLVKSDKQRVWEKDNKSFFDRVIDNIKNFFKSLFNIKSSKFDEMQSEEFANMSLDDVMAKFGDKMLEGHLKNYVDDYTQNVSKSLSDLKRKLKESGDLIEICYG